MSKYRTLMSNLSMLINMTSADDPVEVEQNVCFLCTVNNSMLLPAFGHSSAAISLSLSLSVSVTTSCGIVLADSTPHS